ncbi:MAG: hypothetical protein H7Z14_16800 [Anaerolineae bacterium]|nr:hypothetical protein [Phycisphaerae bacterium]
MSFQIELQKRLSRRVLLVLVAATGTLAGLTVFGPVTTSTVVARALSADPTGDEVMNKYIEATGGKAAYEKIKSRAITGKIKITPPGLDGELKTVTKAPKLSHTTINFAGMGKFESGVNGDVVWEKNPITGVRILEGVEKDRALREADVESGADWKKHYASAENKGVKEINGKPAYEILLTPKEGPAITQYFDKDSGLLVQLEMHVARPEGEFDVVSNPSDWKEFGGIKVATKTKQTVKDVQEQTITIDNVEINSDIPDSTFDLPPDVKAMVAAPPATKPSK